MSNGACDNAATETDRTSPLHYAPPALGGRRALTPQQYRNVLLWFIGVLLALTIAWWVAMFLEVAEKSPMAFGC